jgi:hypothetical protein
MNANAEQEAEYFIPMDGAKYNRSDCEISNYGHIRKNGEPYNPNYTKRNGWTTKMRFNRLDNNGNLIDTKKGKNPEQSDDDSTSSIDTKKGKNPEQSDDDSTSSIDTKKGKNPARMTYVKHLVAYYFIANESNYQYVLHIDGNKRNLFYKNLQWVGEEAKNTYVNDCRKETYKQIQSGEINHDNKIMEETDNMDPSNFVSIGMIQTSKDTIRDFRRYSISKDGKTVLTKTGKLKSKLKGRDDYVVVNLIDANKDKKVDPIAKTDTIIDANDPKSKLKDKRNSVPMLMHKLINVVLKGGKYEDQVDHGDEDKTNNSLDNLEPVTAQENSIRANGVSFYKVDADTMQIVETYRAISEAFPELKVQKMIMGSFHNKRVYNSFQWRLASDKDIYYKIRNNTIIDIEPTAAANNLKKVDEINQLLQIRKSCLSISVFIGKSEDVQTFHCSEFNLDMQMSWDNMKSRKTCYYCKGSPKYGLQRVIPVYKYTTNRTFVCKYDHILHVMDNDLEFSDGYEAKHTAAVLKCCLEKSNTAYGYIWSFYKPTDNKLVRNLAKLDPMTLKRFKQIKLFD